MVLRLAFAALNRLLPAQEAFAHCDIPCGIYDPHAAQVAALTCVRMNQLIEQLEAPAAAAGAMPSKEDRDRYVHALERYTTTKEEHAELVKKEVRIIWGDYFKPEHVEKFPELHNVVWNIMKLASRVRQEVNLQAAQELVTEVQKFADIFWQTKGASVRRQGTLMPVGGEYVYPVAK
ncbi:MAG: superoxide dismutase, Ni [Chloroflexi bacterium]|nr:superoxide dismutase, Ni [Chloroflexota bacterium]